MIGKVRCPMEVEDICKIEGYSKQYFYRLLSSGLGNMYRKLETKLPDLTPFEIVNAMREFFGCTETLDVKMFYNSLPEKVKNKVKKSLEKRNLN